MNHGRAMTWRMVVSTVTAEGVVLRFAGEDDALGGITVHLSRKTWEDFGYPVGAGNVGPAVCNVEVTALWPSALELHKADGTPVPTELADVWTEGYRTGKSTPGNAEAFGTPYDEKPRKR